MIPDFEDDGTLPIRHPDGQADPMPYDTTLVELVERFGTTKVREALLRDLLAHRARLQQLGWTSGVQWVAGSFVEDVDEPRDVDVVSFPDSNPDYFDPEIDEDVLGDPGRIDVHVVLPNWPRPTIVRHATSWYELFTARRNAPGIRKGFVSVSMDPTQDYDALVVLESRRTNA